MSTKPIINPLDCGTLQEAYERGRAEMQAEVDRLEEKCAAVYHARAKEAEEYDERIAELESELVSKVTDKLWCQKLRGNVRACDSWFAWNDALERIAQLETALRAAREVIGDSRVPCRCDMSTGASKLCPRCRALSTIDAALAGKDEP